jgi:hypothetical protein
VGRLAQGEPSPATHVEKKHLEKLDYMHHNPVKRRLVTSSDQWPWSSFRSYFLQDSSVLTMDRLA